MFDLDGEGYGREFEGFFEYFFLDDLYFILTLEFGVPARLVFEIP